MISYPNRMKKIFPQAKVQQVQAIIINNNRRAGQEMLNCRKVEIQLPRGRDGKGKVR